jgi:cytochrome oxidase Cu insertion factor (SCO1/SenC/PrrC family)
MIALVLLACTSKAPTSAAVPVSLHGERPTAPVPLPDFHAVDQHGQPRSKEALLGHPTVLWFYPAAATAG